MIVAGQKVGPYRVLSTMRESELGQLYVAKRPGIAGPGGHVTLLVVHPHLAAEPRFVDPLLADVLLATRVRHPNVAAAEELGQDRGTYFVVADFVDGATLRRLVEALAARGRRLRPAVAAHIAMAVADGLHAAHEASDGTGVRLGLLHGDLSAERILVGYDGEVRVSGFGVARARQCARALAVDDLVEEPAPLAPAEDLRAVGHALWEMLTAVTTVDPAVRDALRAWLRDTAAPCPIDGLTAAHEKLVRWLVDLVDPAKPVPVADAWQLRQGLGRFCPGADQVTASDLGDLLGAALEGEEEPPWASVPEVRTTDRRRRHAVRPEALDRHAPVLGAADEAPPAREEPVTARPPAPPVRVSSRPPAAAAEAVEADWLALPPPPPRLEPRLSGLARLVLVLAALVVAGLAAAGVLLGTDP